MPELIDISVPLGPDTTVFPGDPPPRLHWPGWSHARGDPANVACFDGCAHHATHVDAPWHFVPGGRRIDEVPLDYLVGPCTVIYATAAGTCVDARLLENAGIPRDCMRLLIRTRNSDTDYWREPFRQDFVYLHQSAAQWCADQGFLTVGFDYLTIDPPHETTFPAHLAILGAGGVILESINLRGVPPGEYELLAAPVRLQGADAAWCRAVLRKLPVASC